jgi:malonate decarboxylase beta subunit
LDAADRALIWSLIGGEQRHAVGLVDDLLEDDAEAVAAAVRGAFARGMPALERSAQVEYYVERLATIDLQQPLDGKRLRALWNEGKEP